MLERDHIESQKSEIMDQKNRLEKQKEKLVRENEKLKNDNKNNKRMMYGAASAVASQIPSYLQKFSGNKEGNTSFGGNQALNLGPSLTGSHSSAKFAFKNFIGDGMEKFGDMEKSGSDLSGIEDISQTSQKENLM